MVNKHRLNIQDLTKTEHDMYIMGTTMACMGCPTERNDGKERKKQRAKYRFWVNKFLGLLLRYSLFNHEKFFTKTFNVKMNRSNILTNF